MFRISQTRSLDISVPEPLIRTKFCNRSQKITSIIMRSFRLLTKFLLITDSFRAAAKPSIIDEHCFADVEGEGFKVSNLASRPLSDLEKQKELCECK